MGTKKDPRIRAFLRRALATIAAAGGLNESSRAQLRALAENLRLTDDEWRSAWDELVSAESYNESLTRYEQAFAKHFRSEIRKLPDRVLPLRVEERAIRLAENRYQISEVRTRFIIERECERLRVSRISRSDAEQYIEQVVIQELEGRREPEPTQLQRLYAFAKTWGVRREVVDAFVDETIADNLRVWQRLERMSLAWQRLGMLAMIALATVLIGGYMIWLTRRAAPSNESADTNTTAIEERVPEWWPAAEIESLLSNQPTDVAEFSNLASTAMQPVEKRTEVYQRWWMTAVDETDAEVRRLRLQMLIRCLSADPEAPAPQTWLADAMARTYSESFATVREVEWKRKVACWQLVAELAGSAMHDTEYGNELIAAARQRLQQAHIGRIDFNLPIAELRDHICALIVVDQWQRLRQTMFANPRETAPQFGWLRRLSESLPQPMQDWRLHSQTVCQFLLHHPQLWMSVRQEIPVAILHADEQNLADWLRIHLEATTPSELVELLSRPLLERVFDRRPGLAPTEIDRSLYEAYQQIMRRRHARLLNGFENTQRAANALASTPSDGPNEPRLIVQWASLANDALLVLEAVRRGEYEILPDTLGRIEPSQFGFSAARPPLSPNRRFDLATPSDRRTLTEALAVLGQDDPQVASRQRSAIQKLVEVSERIEDLTAIDAKVLARYYLGSHPPADWLYAERLAPKFLQWPRFLLALAHGIEDGQGELDAAMSLAQLAIGRELELTRDAAWRATLSDALRQQAVLIWNQRHLSDANHQVREWDRVPAALTAIYRQRGTMIHGRHWVDGSAASDLRAAAESLVVQSDPSAGTGSRSGLRAALRTTHEIESIWLIADWFVRGEFGRVGQMLLPATATSKVSATRRQYEAGLTSDMTLASAWIHTERQLCQWYLFVADQFIQTRVLRSTGFRPLKFNAAISMPATIEGTNDTTAGSDDWRSLWPQLRPEVPSDFRDLAEAKFLASGSDNPGEEVAQLYLLAARYGNPELRSSSLRGLVATAGDADCRARFERIAQLWDPFAAPRDKEDVLPRRDEGTDRQTLAKLLAALSREDVMQARTIWESIDEDHQATFFSQFGSPRDLQRWCRADALSDIDLLRIVRWQIELARNSKETVDVGQRPSINWALLSGLPAPLPDRLPILP